MNLQTSIAPALMVIAVTASPSEARTERSHTPIAAFKKHHPCPATDRKSGPCPGYVIDHIEPLCAGGADDPGNMQWQTTKEAKEKDRNEAKQCAALRRSK